MITCIGVRIGLLMNQLMHPEAKVVLRHLATKLDLGVPVIPGLRAAVIGVRSAGVTRAIEDMQRSIARGDTIAESMSLHPEIFPPESAKRMERHVQGERLSSLCREIAEDW